MITADSVLFELRSLTYKEVVRIKDEKCAISCAAALVNCLYLNFKNRLMYIPKDHHDTEETYTSIYKEFNGKNHNELAVKYNRSVNNIYAITRNQKTRYIKKVQNDIFPEDIEEEKIPFTLIVIEEYLPEELSICGLTKDQSKTLSNKISNHLQKTFPGISIYISESAKNKINQKNQTSLF